MNMRKFAIWKLFIAIMLILAGCTRFMLIEPSSELEQEARAFISSPDNSRVYFYRSQGLAPLANIWLYLNDKKIGRSRSKAFIIFELDPGLHTFRSENGNLDYLSILTKAGEIYFVRQEIEIGVFKPLATFKRVDPDEGKADVMKCKFLGIWKEPEFRDNTEIIESP